MSEIKLARSRRILEKTAVTKYGVLFQYPVEEGEKLDSTTITLDKSVWEDLGEPETITITVEPGDTINIPVEEASVKDYAAGKKDSEMFTDIASESPSDHQKVDYRSASSGRFVTKTEAEAHPDTTVAEAN